MPFAQALCSHLNKNFGPVEVDPAIAEQLRRGERLADVARDIDAPERLRDFLHQYLVSMPRAMEAAMTGLLVANLQENDRRPITFAWAPGYDWELTIWDVADAHTRGGITVLLRSRYPNDPSPLRE
jgi:hypothetical protein